jgi:hypothetical protein
VRPWRACKSLLAFDAPFGFNALLGLIALAGMIMRNTVILIDQIKADDGVPDAQRHGRAPYTKAKSNRRSYRNQESENMS